MRKKTNELTKRINCVKSWSVVIIIRRSNQQCSLTKKGLGVKSSCYPFRHVSKLAYPFYEVIEQSEQIYPNDKQEQP